MPVPASTPTEAWFAAGFFVLLSLAVYGDQIRRLIREGGKVPVGELDLPELLMSIVFASYFGWLMAASARHHESEGSPVDINTLLPSSMIFLIFVAAIASFIRFRGLRLRRVFGLVRVPPLTVVLWAAPLIVAAFPLVFAANAITVFAIHDQLKPQPLVELFNKVARLHDYAAMGKILVSAVVFAPICEEFIFRGFFYGVWKRYLGPLSAGFFASLLFAAFHTSLSALSPLFILAVCLNIAYERSGSLLVPMCMHAIFNLTNLLIMFGQAQASAGK